MRPMKGILAGVITRSYLVKVDINEGMSIACYIYVIVWKINEFIWFNKMPKLILMSWVSYPHIKIISVLGCWLCDLGMILNPFWA